MKHTGLKKKLLYASKLYLILDLNVAVTSPLYIIKKIADKKAIDIVQLRDKSLNKVRFFSLAKDIKFFLKKSHILFIINDYIDIAESLDADGIHLGQSDLPLPLARRLLGKDKIIGLSCHSFKEAKEAEQMGADYISIGPIFKTPIKSEYLPLGTNILKRISQSIKIPFFCIGGINFSNINRLKDEYGVEKFAFCRLLCAKKNLDTALNQLRIIKNDPM